MQTASSSMLNRLERLTMAYARVAMLQAQANSAIVSTAAQVSSVSASVSSVNGRVNGVSSQLAAVGGQLAAVGGQVGAVSDAVNTVVQQAASTAGGLNDLSSHFFFNGGNVGIGVPTPQHALEIAGDIHATGKLLGTGYVFSRNTASSAAGPSTSNLTLTGTLLASNVGIGLSTAPNYPLQVATNGSGGGGGPFTDFQYLSVSGTGYLGPGGPADSTPVAVHCPDGRAVAVAFDAISDRRLKTNVADLPDALVDRVMNALRPRSYRHVDPLNHGGGGGRVGFVAQEVLSDVGGDLPAAVNAHRGDIPSVMKLYAFRRPAVAQDPLVLVVLGVAASVASAFAPGRTRLVFRDHAHLPHRALVQGFKLPLGELTVRLDAPLPPQPDDRLFLYGEEVHDCRAVDHKQLFAVALAATQRLMRQVAELQRDVAALKAARA